MEIITIYTDGRSRGNPGPAAIGACVVDDSGTVLQEVSEHIGNATDNFAEYQAVLRGLQIASDDFGEQTKELYFDVTLSSDLVKKQLNGESQITEPGLVPYFIAIHNLRVSSFPHLTFTHAPRESNKEADRLVNEALDA